MGKQNRIGLICSILLFFLMASPAIGSTYYGKDGAKLDREAYDKIVNNRHAEIKQVIKDGYGDHVAGFQDPVILRKKRIEQWQEWRKSRGEMRSQMTRAR